MQFEEKPNQDHEETKDIRSEETKDIGPNKSLGEFCGSGIYLAPKIEYCMG
jgi:hypothetical protein